MTNPDQALYVVACTDLHSAVGPFAGLKSATMAAKILTEREGKKGCVYIPVLLTTLDVLKSETPKAPKGSDDDHRGYL